MEKADHKIGNHGSKYKPRTEKIKMGGNEGEYPLAAKKPSWMFFD